jgi:SAM-dependent methyltransferase
MLDSYQTIFKKRGQLYHDAMTHYPHARDEEFKILLSYSKLHKNDIVADMPSGGCYLKRYLKLQNLIFLDPTQEFLHNCTCEDQTIHTDLESTPLITNSIDTVFSLAGMHHALKPELIYSEIHRVLKDEGYFIYADVLKGSKEDTFLNSFVHNYNSSGHQGVFLDSGIKKDLDKLSFNVNYYEYKTFTWNFNNENEMVDFVKKLFGLDLANYQTVLHGLEDILGYSCTKESCKLNWGLLYIQAKKSI